MTLWGVLWKYLNTPSSHEGNPAQEAVNQFGHIALGALVSLVVCLIWFFFFEEMPVRTYVWISVTLSYLFVIELGVQGWRGKDTLIDTWFVHCGVILPLKPFLETIKGDGTTVHLEFRPDELLVLLLIAFGTLALHLWNRIRSL